MIANKAIRANLDSFIASAYEAGAVVKKTVGPDGDG
jgi:hypothetical protein